MISNTDFDDEYLDVLQNIEMGIVMAFREHPELTDYNIESALDAMIKTYRGEAINRAPQVPNNPLTLAVYQEIRAVCEWRLGREELFEKNGKQMDLDVDTVAIEAIFACLKRLRKSIKFWSSEGGRQGYLNYISQFF